MKKRLNNLWCIWTLLLAVVATHANAEVTMSFPGWDLLTQNTPDIIIAQCNRTPDPYKDHGDGPTGPLFYSDMEIISILKGATNWGTEPLKLPRMGKARLSSEYVPRQGEYYLIFSIYYQGEFQASEDYKVVPLGLSFSTNSIANKPLEQQIRILLGQRLSDLNHQIDKDQKEKERLEQMPRQ